MIAENHSKRQESIIEIPDKIREDLFKRDLFIFK